jgi:glycosyltransferase involved in cell wall biosynthesis
VTPTVSVCIPACNHGRFLGQAIRSALEQPGVDLEVVVADNASEDETPAVVASFHDPRLRAVRSDVRIGIMHNWNRATSLARGRYVKVLQSDDILQPGALQEEAAVLDAQPRAGLVAGVRSYVDEAGRPLGTKHPFAAEGHFIGVDVLPELLIRRPLGNPSFILFRRQSLEEAGAFRQEVATDGDLDLWCRILCRWDLYYLPRVVALSRMHGGSLTAELVRSGTHIEESLSDLPRMLLPELRQHLSPFQVRAAYGVFGVLAWIHALAYARQGQWARARRTLRDARRHGSPVLDGTCFGLWCLGHPVTVWRDFVSTQNCLLAHQYSR